MGGTPLAAMHKYDPISSREIFDNSSVSYSHSLTDVYTNTHTKKLFINLVNIKYTFYYLPISDLFMFIFALSSRFHLTVGIGLPVARHLSVMFDPSRTITSLELNESSMFGGTATKNKCLVNPHRSAK